MPRVFSQGWVVADLLATRRLTSVDRGDLWRDSLSVELDTRSTFERRAKRVLRTLVRVCPEFYDYHAMLTVVESASGGVFATLELSCHAGCRTSVRVGLDEVLRSVTDYDEVVLHSNLEELLSYLRSGLVSAQPVLLS